MAFGIFNGLHCPRWPALIPEPTVDQIEEAAAHGLMHRTTRQRQEQVAARSA